MHTSMQTLARAHQFFMTISTDNPHRPTDFTMRGHTVFVSAGGYFCVHSNFPLAVSYRRSFMFESAGASLQPTSIAITRCRLSRMDIRHSFTKEVGPACNTAAL